MILLGLMPVVQVLLFGFVLTNEIKDASIAVLDPSRNIQSMDLTNKLASSGYFKVVQQVQSPTESKRPFGRLKSKWPLFSLKNSQKASQIPMP